jgi:glutamyl/glutaminyl-tRNA synthetase
VSLRSRIAPTPSGYLHLGNLANFLLIEKLVSEVGGSLFLRIDDCDGTRARPEFVDHIFETLRWLGVTWHEGPRDADEFYLRFSQTNRKEHYFRKLESLRGRTYACDCSRKDVGAVYPGTCRDRGIAFLPGRTALRVRVDDPRLAARFGDAVLWRKDDGPAYHWASVVDDLEGRVNLIVRGDDLRDSTELQKYLAALVAPGGFDGVRFVHHPLLTDDAGNKLSKSQDSLSVRQWIAAGKSAQELRAKLAPVIAGWRL